MLGRARVFIALIAVVSGAACSKLVVDPTEKAACVVKIKLVSKVDVSTAESGSFVKIAGAKRLVTLTFLEAKGNPGYTCTLTNGEVINLVEWRTIVPAALK